MLCLNPSKGSGLPSTRRTPGDRLRTKVWWPSMDGEAERRCAECYGCQLVTKNVSPPPLKPTSMPQQAWEELALDLLSGDSLLVLVDYYSRWIEVDVIRATTSNMGYLRLCGLIMVPTCCLRRWRIT